MSILNVLLFVPRSLSSPSELLFPDAFSTTNDRYKVLDICVPAANYVIPDLVDLIVLCGPSADLLRIAFLTTCQAIIGNHAFLGRKYFFSDELPDTIPEATLPYLRLFDRLFVLNPINATAATLVPRAIQVENPIIETIVDAQTNLSRSDRPRSIGVYIPNSIAERNPFFQRKICQTLIDGIVNVFPSAESLDCIKLLCYSESDQSLCTDLRESLLKKGAAFDIRIERLSGIDKLREHVDGLISWDPILTLAAAGMPCNIFCCSNASEVSLLDPDSMTMNVIRYDNDARYKKPKFIELASLNDALLTLRRGDQPILLKKNVSTSPSIHSLIEQGAKSNTQIVVGPLPWTADGTARVHDESVAKANSTAPALHTKDIDDRAGNIFDSLGAFSQTLASSDPLSLARFICYKLTKRAEPSSYVYGTANLLQSLGPIEAFDASKQKRLLEALHWLVKDAFIKGFTFDYPTVHDFPKWLLEDPMSVYQPVHDFAINLDSSFHQSLFQGVHRSGWAHVKSGLSIFHDPASKLFVDLYCDATFGWMEKILTFDRTIPYNSAWLGFFHHGWDTAEAFSVKSAITKTSFKLSLPTCRAICVLSDDLAQKLSKGLMETYPNARLPPILTFRHPTEFVPKTREFAMGTFLANEARRVVHVGSFYRNSFSIYELPLGLENGVPNILNLQKSHLQSANSHRYFCPATLEAELIRIGNNDVLKPDQIVDMESPLISSICGNSAASTDTSTCDNVYMQGLIDHVKSLNRSVEVINNLNDDDYDDLLSKNIIFVNLLDASAVNTLLECIVRNTPIIINPLPAIVELLGPNYPLYYQNLKQAALFMTSEVLLREASEYLSVLDKTMLRLDYFLMNFRDRVRPLVADLMV